MNLSLYSIQAFVVLDTEGTRVLAKYYRSKSHPQGESKELLTLKDQKAFEKGLWQKTKKAGGAWFLCISMGAMTDDADSPSFLILFVLQRTLHLRRHHFVRLAPGGVQALAGPHHVLHRWPDGKRDYALLGANIAYGRAHNASTEFVRKAGASREPGLGPALSRRDYR